MYYVLDVPHLKHRVMKIKIFILAFSIVFLYSDFMARGQNATATTTVNLVLADVLSIHPGSVANGNSVDLNFNSVEDYNSGKIATIPNSLIITFSKAFDIRVKANGANFEGGTNSIPVEVLTIQRNQSSTITGNSNSIILSTEDQVLINAADVGYGLNLDLDYIIPADRSSSPDILGKPAGTYTQTVTYSATAL